MKRCGLDRRVAIITNSIKKAKNPKTFSEVKELRSDDLDEMPRIFQRTHEALKRYATNRDLKARWIFLSFRWKVVGRNFCVKIKHSLVAVVRESISNLRYGEYVLPKRGLLDTSNLRLFLEEVTAEKNGSLGGGELGMGRVQRKK